MKLSEIRKILDEYDAAEKQLQSEQATHEHSPLPQETVKRWNSALDAKQDLDLEALVRQWLPVVEAAVSSNESARINRYCLYCGAVPNEDHCDDCPEGISISNGDLTIARGKNANRCELKYRTPILSYAQKVEYEAHSFHVVVHYGRNITEAGLNFDSDHFDFYCPYDKHKFERVERGWLLIGDCHTVEREMAILILCAFAPFPCCQKFTIKEGKRT